MKKAPPNTITFCPEHGPMPQGELKCRVCGFKAELTAPGRKRGCGCLVLLLALVLAGSASACIL